ncbi:MAG: NADH-quinone oxidoreductase subunit G, partial [Rhodocyclales bacterium]|nr:NADH-quinone oxidoreductase subunit G [Rhodocyclales bacterium]
ADAVALRSPSLQQTSDARLPTASLNPQTAQALLIEDGLAVKVSQGDAGVVLIAKFDENVPLNCVRVAAAHTSTAALGEMFGEITVERA